MSIPVVTRSRLAVVTVALSLIMALRPVSPPTERVLVTGGNGYGVPSVTACSECPSHPACNVQNSVATQSQQQLQNVGARQHKALRSCVCWPSQPTRCIDFSGQQQSVGYRTLVCAHRSLTQLLRTSAGTASQQESPLYTRLSCCDVHLYTHSRTLSACARHGPSQRSFDVTGLHARVRANCQPGTELHVRTHKSRPTRYHTRMHACRYLAQFVISSLESNGAHHSCA